MSETTYIYGLLCPLDGKIHYVGKSNDPVLRLRSHMNEMGQWQRWVAEYGDRYANGKRVHNAKLLWLDRLDQRSLRPKLVILEEAPKEELPCGRIPHSAELRWIERLAAEGHPLTNEEKRLKDRKNDDDESLREALELGRQMFGQFSPL